MDEYILTFSEWETQKRNECQRAYKFCKDVLKSPLTEEEFSKVWYSESSDKKGIHHLANMCMSIFQSRKSRAGNEFEKAITSKHIELGITFYNQAYVDLDGNVSEKKPKLSCHKIDCLIPTSSSRKLSDMILISKKTTLRERYRQDLDFVGKCKMVIFLTKETPEKAKIDTITGYGCILVYPNAKDSDKVWSYAKYFSEITEFQRNSVS